MRNVIRIVSVVLLVGVIAACAGSPEPAADPEPQQQASDLPSWYLNPPQAEDAIYGVGSAQMSSLDTSRRMAVSRAREDIAFQMNAAIEAAIVDYAQEAGVDDNTQVVSFVENISRQVTEVTLSGASPEEVAQGSDGTIYALVSYSKSGFTDAASEAFQRNEDAAFAEFKAEQALDSLDQQLEDNPPQAGNVDE